VADAFRDEFSVFDLQLLGNLNHRDRLLIRQVADADSANSDVVFACLKATTGIEIQG